MNQPKPTPEQFTHNGVLMQPHFDNAVRAWEKLNNMEQNGIIEGNNLIAEFMGGKYYKGVASKETLVFTNPTIGNGHFDLSCLKFHSSWDWLMPVLSRIKNSLQNWPTRPSKNHCCKGDLIEVDMQCRLWEIDILKTWQHVVEFIKWYNQNK